ncbi:NmrA family NAD(P)-binding protein [Mucilaginibacter litoreus]|uniref:NmrA family NAD(P)-binding protein n=1 Tax=Mucilaginibacter litoreus TaxID=1048221 RepID=A0ABW3AXB6_9SPHI
MSKQKITVCGATGNQGGAVVTELLMQEKYAVTALTRDPGSAAARSLAVRGAHIVKADLRDMNSLKAAFNGADGIFGLTQPWNYELGCFDINAEIRQAKNIIWAAKAAGVPGIVFSTILNLSATISKVPWIDCDEDHPDVS